MRRSGSRIASRKQPKPGSAISAGKPTDHRGEKMLVPLIDRYKHKIKTAEEVRALVGDRPRKDKVIMCHGVFDVVHPGHVRHLLYAKSKADILVASLTAD